MDVPSNITVKLTIIQGIHIMKQRNFVLYAAISFIFTLAIAYGLGIVTTRTMTDQITKAHLRQLPETVQSIFREHPGVYPWFSMPPRQNLPTPVKNMFTALTDIPGVFRVKLWDKQGTILWCDRQELIGESYAQDYHFQFAATGKTAFNNEGHSRVENMGELGEETVVEVYIPALVDGKVIGVIELYENDSVLHDQLIEAEQAIKRNVLFAGVILYLFLLTLYFIIQAFLIKKPKP